MGKGVEKAVRIPEWRNSYTLESRTVSESEDSTNNPDWDVGGTPAVVFVIPLVRPVYLFIVSISFDAVKLCSRYSEVKSCINHINQFRRTVQISVCNSNVNSCQTNVCVQWLLWKIYAGNLLVLLTATASVPAGKTLAYRPETKRRYSLHIGRLWTSNVPFGWI